MTFGFWEAPNPQPVGLGFREFSGFIGFIRFGENCNPETETPDPMYPIAGNL